MPDKCQNICHMDDIYIYISSDRMPDRMSKYKSDRMSDTGYTWGYTVKCRICQIDSSSMPECM